MIFNALIIYDTLKIKQQRHNTRQRDYDSIFLYN